MNLTQINLLWEEYKEKYDIDSDAKISAVQYDTEEFVEGCFNLIELMDGKYILHLNPRMHIYSDNYVKFILFHEFTHFYDFIKSPYEDKTKLIMWMNAYSEYHACRVTLARFIEMFTLDTVHIDKIQIPGPFKEISIRRLLVEAVYRAKLCFDAFFFDYQLTDFANGFRQLMYLLGYLSLFRNDELMVEETLKSLHINDYNFTTLYTALKEMDFDKVIELYKDITDEATLVYLKAMFRRFYDPSILPDEEIDKITLENYQDYIEELDRKLQEQIQTEEEQFEESEQTAAFRQEISLNMNLASPFYQLKSPFIK